MRFTALTLLLAALDAGAMEIIAHRGASAYLPEHTLAGYAMAYAMGADWIEPDLVMTRDGVLVARHDLTLETTTDVATVFPDRVRADDHFYAIDFTSEEIARLSAVDPHPRRFPNHAGLFEVPTFAALLRLVGGLNRATGCKVGVIPEIKGSRFHHAAGLDPEAALLAALERTGFDRALVRVQSFEPEPLERLAATDPTLYLVQLAGDPRWGSDAALERVGTYADALGAAKDLLYDDLTLVGRAHAQGLDVHAWTLRADQLGEGFTTFRDELRALAEAGVDGVFTDHPDLAAAALGAGTGCSR